MLQYLLKRVLLFVPTLVVISLFAFWLNSLAPGDPVESCMPLMDDTDFELSEKAYAQTAHRFGFDLPLFYFSFTSAAFPDTLHLIANRLERESLGKFIGQYGNWPFIESYYHQIKRLQKKVSYLPDSLDQDKRINIRRALGKLTIAYKNRIIKTQFDEIQKGLQDTLIAQHLAVDVNQLQLSYNKIQEKATPNQLYIPAFYWYGTGNQYHRWASNFLRGDFGISCQNGENVADRLKAPLFWTLVMNLLSIFIAYVVSIPLGLYAAVHRNSIFDRISSLFLFILFSLPSFWIGTLLVVFLTTPEYGMNWFEGIGLGNLPTNAPFWERFWETSRHLILPVFCISYAGLAFVSRQMRGSMLNVLQQDYIRTARAKGVDKRRVVWKHGLRNALFPLITLFATVFPAAIGGAVVIEVIFNIPGMGREVFNAILSKDWNIVYTVLILASILTMLGNLVADILYAIVDPRVSFNEKQ